MHSFVWHLPLQRASSHKNILIHFWNFLSKKLRSYKHRVKQRRNVKVHDEGWYEDSFQARWNYQQNSFSYHVQYSFHLKWELHPRWQNGTFTWRRAKRQRQNNSKRLRNLLIVWRFLLSLQSAQNWNQRPLSYLCQRVRTRYYLLLGNRQVNNRRT